jgi:IS4 transposase
MRTDARKKQQKNDMRTGALEKTQRKRCKRPVRKQELQKSKKNKTTKS